MTNCMGYAIKDYRWLSLGIEYSNYPKELPKKYNFLIPVEKKDMVLGKKYIAFRYGKLDFHFVKRDEKGHWREKCGISEPQPISKKEVFSKSWKKPWGFYSSKIFIFEDIR